MRRITVLRRLRHSGARWMNIPPGSTTLKRASTDLKLRMRHLPLIHLQMPSASVLILMMLHNLTVRHPTITETVVSSMSLDGKARRTGPLVNGTCGLSLRQSTSLSLDSLRLHTYYVSSLGARLASSSLPVLPMHASSCSAATARTSPFRQLVTTCSSESSKCGLDSRSCIFASWGMRLLLSRGTLGRGAIRSSTKCSQTAPPFGWAAHRCSSCLGQDWKMRSPRSLSTLRLAGTLALILLQFVHGSMSFSTKAHLVFPPKNLQDELEHPWYHTDF